MLQGFKSLPLHTFPLNKDLNNQAYFISYGGMTLIRKGLAVGIILLFVGTCIIPAIAKPIPITANTVPHPGNFFGLNSNVEISWDANQTEEPIIPRGSAG